jgi:hypothetical protein
MNSKSPALLALVLLSLPVLAAEAPKPTAAARVNLAPASSSAGAPAPAPTGVGGGGATDLLNVTKFNPETNPSKARIIKLSAGCTEATGRSLKPEDAGYENCMKDAQTNRPSAPDGAARPGASATFKIGE